MTFLKPDSKHLMEYFIEFTRNRDLGMQLSSQAYKSAGNNNGQGNYMVLILIAIVALLIIKK